MIIGIQRSVVDTLLNTDVDLVTVEQLLGHTTV
jgi:hypothetical protein